MLKIQIAILVLAALVVVGCGDDDDNVSEFIAFDAFLEDVKMADIDTFADDDGARVRDEAAFDEMREHIVVMYDGAVITSSFFHAEQYVDCVTIETQASVRLLDIAANLDAPERTLAGDRGTAGQPGETELAESPLALGLEDAFGNPISCEDNSIPMGRLTLDVLTRFETLAHFFSKGGNGTGSLPSAPSDGSETQPEVGASERRYAYAIQNVTNYGGNSWLNLWSPSLGNDGTMSLSQQWYTAGEGTGLQTLEGGWQVLPSKYQTDKAVLFIYWTADGYGSTGCYNLDCPGFVQINNDWFLGGTWSNYSKKDGAQWGFELQWKLYNGNWWMFLKGPGTYEAVGYYPVRIYDGGRMASAALSILYGGETATTNVWPEMGSGAFAAEGWQNAAFEKTIFYIPRDENNGTGVWADLSAQEPAPSCYTIDLTLSTGGSSWGTYFFFGGPGGSPC